MRAESGAGGCFISVGLMSARTTPRAKMINKHRFAIFPVFVMHVVQSTRFDARAIALPVLA